MPLQATLPTFESQLDEIARAERGDGWLCACEEQGQFLALTQELVTALAESLRDLDAGPILEICAGRGELAEAIRATGVHVVATDADPPADAPVTRASAEEALRRFRPAVVLGSFVPVDAGVDELVLGFPSVRHYVVLGARIGGLFGSSVLWQAPGWTAEPLEQVARWMLTRHDVWLGPSEPAVLQHGEAWHLRRQDRNEHHEPISD
jgi:hypothetical protein